MPSQRIVRVQNLLREEISAILQRKLKDPRVSMVTITRVEADPDLHNARIFVSVFGEVEHQREALDGLRSAAGFIRAGLMEVLHLRPMPVLDFRYDESLALGARTLDILDRIRRKHPASEAAPESGEGADRPGSDS